jgi:hypothetical protein
MHRALAFSPGSAVNAMSLNSERAVVALALFLLSVGLFFSTYSFPESDMGAAFDPGFFPRIVLGCLIALAVPNLLIDLRARSGWDATGLRDVLILMVLIVVYVVVMPKLGFFATSVVLSGAFLVILGVRSPLGIAAVAIGVPGALVALFNHILSMPLPTSPLFWWI